MKGFTIFKRVGLGYLIILLVVAGIGVYSTLKLVQLSRITRSIHSIDAKVIKTADRLRDATLSQRVLEKKYSISKDEDFLSQFTETGKYIEKDLVRLGNLVNTPEEVKVVGEIKELQNRYLSTVKDEIQLIKNGEKYLFSKYQERKTSFTSRMTNRLAKLVEMAKVVVDKKIELSEKTARRSSIIVATITSAAVIMATLIAFITARTINRPIFILMKGIKGIAEGMFEKHLRIPSPPEIKELATAFNNMSDRLKEVDEMKADLISHVSHELRTPLAVIREAVSLLSPDDIPTVSVGKRHKLLGIIGEECERLIASVNRILDLSRMNAGMIDYHIEEVGVLPIIEKSVLNIRPISEKSGIRLDIKLDEDLPPAKIDGDKIGLVLNNLLENALKFTPAGGHVSVTGCTINIKKGSRHISGEDKGIIKISVSDNGCGIPQEEIDNIFNKFIRLNGKGAGLGLYIARHIIIAHGGDLWVESVQGKGSVFSFTIPVC